MKSIKIMLPVFVFQVALGITAQAVTLNSSAQGSGQEASQMLNVNERLQVLSARLNLNQNQQESVKAILDEQYAQTEAVKQDKSLSAEDSASKLRAVEEASSSKIRALLNDEQKRKYAEFEQEMSVHAGHGQGRGPDGIHDGHGQGRGEGRPTVAEHLKQLSEKLNLSSEQQAKIQPILEDQRAQMQKIWQNTSLADNDKRSQADTVREATNSKIRAVLTDPQRKKFDSIL